MRVSVIGTGYVGLVAGACFAETGNDVLCADKDDAKVARLTDGEIPIFEPGLEPLVRGNLADGRLRFTSDVGMAVRHGRVVFIAVGTPPQEDGSADLQHVLAVATLIGQQMEQPTVVVTKSTVPVGTAAKVRAAIEAETDIPFYVCSNPEFLKEGAAVDDFMKPDRVVIGTDAEEARAVMAELYDPFVRTGNPIMFMDICSAEITKYAANAMLAARISFMNQIAELCERVGADVSSVRHGMASDRRIGSAFLFPGPGYGGSCFPKDVRALVGTANDVGMNPVLLESIETVNRFQKEMLARKVHVLLGDNLEGQTVAVWGLSFKAGTDDVRESPALTLIERVLAAGATVRVHDPKALETARVVLGDRVTYCTDPYAAVEGASVLVIVTEWLMYRTPDFERIRSIMATPNVIDGRNLYDPDRMRHYGFTYRGVGRGGAST